MKFLSPKSDPSKLGSFVLILFIITGTYNRRAYPRFTSSPLPSGTGVLLGSLAPLRHPSAGILGAQFMYLLMAFLTPILGPNSAQSLHRVVLTQSCPYTVLSSKAQSQAVSSLPTSPPSLIFLGHLSSTNLQLQICPNELPSPRRAPNCLNSLKTPTSPCGGGVLSRSSSPYSEVPQTVCKSLVFCFPLSIPFFLALLWDPFQSVPRLLGP